MGIGILVWKNFIADTRSNPRMKGNIIGMLDGESTSITQTVDNIIVAEGITFFMIARDILWDGIKVIAGHLILPSQGFKI